MSPDLEVWWDGTHQNADRDLLCCDPIPQKREHVPLNGFAVIQVNRSSLTTDAIERCLELHPRTGCTIKMLVAKTGLSYSAVANGLSRLREQGVLRVVGEIPHSGGAARKIYGLAA